MTYCKRCGVKLRSSAESCVLCGQSCENISDTSEEEFPVIKHSNRYRFIVRILWILSVVLVAVSLYVGHITNSKTFWSFIVLGATVYAWTSFLTARKSFRNIGLMIVIQLLAISLLGYLVDYSTGNRGWMIDYVIPFMIIAAQGVVTAIMIARPMLFRDFMIYQLIIGVMGVLSVLLMVFGLSHVRWPYITAVVYSVIIVSGTIILADRKYKQEMVKRFHF